MSLQVMCFDSIHATQWTVDAINRELNDLADIVARCGIPAPFRAELSVVEYVHVARPYAYDFELRVTWEGATEAARLNRWEFLALAPEERIDLINARVHHACRRVLDCVIRDRRGTDLRDQDRAL